MRQTNFIRVVIAVAVFAAAQFALAQNADRNTAGPTKNQLQLRVLEPAQGATITGSSIRVVVGYSKTVFGQGQGTKFGEPNFPQPTFDVYLDNNLKQTLKGGESNVAVIDNVPAGSHKVVVVAKNASNEIIDRQEINVTNSEAIASGTSGGTASTYRSTSGSTAGTTSGTTGSQYSSGTSTTSGQTGQTSSTYSGQTSSTYSGQTPSTATSETTTGSTRSLPATGSSAPRLGALGLCLLAAGLLTARKAR